MGRLVALLVAGFFAAAVVIGLVAAARNVKVSYVTHRDKPLLKRVAEIKRENPGGWPKADPVKTEFDFGTLNPGTTASHVFTIRNAGTVPLVLRQGPTTCKCTIGNLSKDAVFPGKEADLMLEWNTGRSDATFRQSAKIFTNDTTRPEIDFEIYGKVRVACAAEPTALLFPDILPGSTQSAETFVCSQLWPAFLISKIEANVEGLTWEVEPLTADDLSAIDAKSGYRVVVTSPPNFSDDWLNGSLKITAQKPNESDSVETLELTVGGKRAKPVAVYGQNIDEHGVIDFGALPPGKGAKAALMLRVRDNDPRLIVRELRVYPDFVTAQVRPLVDSAGTPKPGLYHLDVEVPRDAPPCSHKGVHSSTVTLDLEHPRMDPLTIKLSFAVKSSELP